MATFEYWAQGSRQRVVVEEDRSTYDCFIVDDVGAWEEVDPGHGMRWGFASRVEAVEAAERRLGERLVPEEGDTAEMSRHDVRQGGLHAPRDGASP